MGKTSGATMSYEELVQNIFQAATLSPFKRAEILAAMREAEARIKELPTWEVS